MAQDEHNSDVEQGDVTEEPLIDDDKPMSKTIRVVLILLAVGMFAGGIVWNYHRARSLKEKRDARKKHEPSIKGPRYVEPPPGDAYPWRKGYDAANSIAARIPPPPGTVRIRVQPDGFAHWLRYLPLKPGQQKVLLHDGQPKRNQTAHWSVLDIDTGPDDLQQGAEAVLRLRAEYLYARNNYDAITFHVTPQMKFSWNQWRKGERLGVVKSGYLIRSEDAKPDDSYANFRNYLNAVFQFADANTLLKDLQPVPDVKDMQIGDVFVHPAKPGHAVIVVDMVRDPKTGDMGFLLAQSFIPAQDVHILVNAYNPQGAPWYRTDFGGKLRTPEWTFPADELRRFP